jgi:hypothetical protein
MLKPNHEKSLKRCIKNIDPYAPPQFGDVLQSNPLLRLINSTIKYIKNPYRRCKTKNKGSPYITTSKTNTKRGNVMKKIVAILT